MHERAYYECEVVDSIATIRFREVPREGPVPNDTDETIALLEEVDADAGVRVTVFVGSDRRFGTARQPARSASVSSREAYERSRKFLRTLVAAEKPIISALNGDVSPPLAISLALLSDISVAERHISLSDSHLVHGAVPASSIFAWPVSVGLLAAKRCLLTGESLTATEAERIGLITEVVAPGNGMARALEYASSLVKLDQTALAQTKRALNAVFNDRMAVLESSLALARLDG